MKDFEVSTLSKEVHKQTKVKISSLKTFILKNKTFRIIMFILITLLVWSVTAGVGFYYVTKKENQPISFSFSLQKDDLFYFKYSYLEGEGIQPTVKYKLGKVGQNNIFDNNGSGFEENIIGMRKGEEKNITMTFPANSSFFPGKTLQIHIKILALVEKNGYHDLTNTLEDGDIAIFDFKGIYNGEPFEGGTAQYYSLLIGSNNFIAGFEDKMVGMKEGDRRNLDLVFPQSYPNKPELAGQPVIFEVYLRSIIKKDDL